MRTDNRKVKNTIISIYFLLLVSAILLATVFKTIGVFPTSSMFVFIGLFLAILFVHFVARYFEYDSDGHKLVIINKGLILTEFINYRQNKVEFDKHKLVSYKIDNYFMYKTLIISIKHRNGRISKERFNVTLLNRKKLRYVRQSLRKIIKENNKRKQAE